ncbi:glycine-rich protein [Musa troglodytarum]|uniref:Glycine-rich protein n=1 Tax=Musa troglodytarum TaxID=320322 RepID=A0A9E7FYY1_9LILI|nr:glycine-rich protein [Musa troglodytarum]
MEEDSKSRVGVSSHKGNTALGKELPCTHRPFLLRTRVEHRGLYCVACCLPLLFSLLPLRHCLLYQTADSILLPKFQAEAVAESTQRAERMEKTSLLLVSLLLLLLVLATADDLEAELPKGKGHGEDDDGAGVPWFGADPGSFFGHGGRFHVPAGIGGGWGGGFGGPSGGYARGGVVRPSVVCSEKGPCYKKRVTCPDSCFTSFSRSGKGYGGGGGGGGCTIDCKKRCTAYC